jgi:hypothetical protein
MLCLTSSSPSYFFLSWVTKYLFVGGFDWLFDKVDQIWWAEFAKG